MFFAAPLVMFFAAAGNPPPAEVRAWHERGRTFVIFPDESDTWAQASVALSTLKRRRAQKKTRQTRFRLRLRSEGGDGRVLAEVAPLSGFNVEQFGIKPRPGARADRYVTRATQRVSVEPATKVEPGSGAEIVPGVDAGRVPPGFGLFVLSPPRAGKRCFTVWRERTHKVRTGARGGRGDEVKRRRDVKDSAALVAQRAAQERVALGDVCVQEHAGPGAFVLQHQSEPTRFHRVRNVVVGRLVRWEAPPLANRVRAISYLVATPPRARATQRPAGLYLHAWGGDITRGYGVWHDADRGALLLASNQVPYDWWTGYHEAFDLDGNDDRRAKKKNKAPPFTGGRVQPYTQARLLAFLDWASAAYALDAQAVFVAGSSMGGTGASMLATAAPARFAWARSDVGVHVPRQNKAFRRSFGRVWGARGAQIVVGTDRVSRQGLSPWTYWDNARTVIESPGRDLPLLIIANGINDDDVGWAQAVQMVKALQNAKQPHVFTWGEKGHRQRAHFAGQQRRKSPPGLRADRSLPAFSACSLDDRLRAGSRGLRRGQINGWITWSDVVDLPDRWSVTLSLLPGSPRSRATVEVTPRRQQGFKLEPGESLRAIILGGGDALRESLVTVDRHGLATVTGVDVGRGKTVLTLTRPPP